MSSADQVLICTTALAWVAGESRSGNCRFHSAGKRAALIWIRLRRTSSGTGLDPSPAHSSA